MTVAGGTIGHLECVGPGSNDQWIVLGGFRNSRDKRADIQTPPEVPDPRLSPFPLIRCDSTTDSPDRVGF